MGFRFAASGSALSRGGDVREVAVGGKPPVCFLEALAPTQGIAAKRRKGVRPLLPWGCRGIIGCEAAQNKNAGREGWRFVLSGKRDSDPRRFAVAQRLPIRYPPGGCAAFPPRGAVEAAVRHTAYIQNKTATTRAAVCFERKTGFGPATSTLARLRSTN